MAAAESLIFGGARGPAKAPKESKALKELKELKDPTVLEEPKVLEKPQERKELKMPDVLKDPKAYGATSIMVCNYFVLGVKAYGPHRSWSVTTSSEALRHTGPPRSWCASRPPAGEGARPT